MKRKADFFFVFVGVSSFFGFCGVFNFFWVFCQNIDERKIKVRGKTKQTKACKPKNPG
jgi:hypothetical protein